MKENVSYQCKYLLYVSQTLHRRQCSISLLTSTDPLVTLQEGSREQQPYDKGNYSKYYVIQSGHACACTKESMLVIPREPSPGFSVFIEPQLYIQSVHSCISYKIFIWSCPEESRFDNQRGKKSYYLMTFGKQKFSFGMFKWNVLQDGVTHFNAVANNKDRVNFNIIIRIGQ